jgi:hypothetical protein
MNFSHVHDCLTADMYDRLFRRASWPEGKVLASTPPEDLMAAKAKAPFFLLPQAGEFPYLTFFDLDLRRRPDWVLMPDDIEANDWQEVRMVASEPGAKPTLEAVNRQTD